LGQCHNLPLMTKMFLCGGACLYTAVTSSKIAREGLPSNGTSAHAFFEGKKAEKTSPRKSTSRTLK
jgi:hypothetical protein